MPEGRRPNILLIMSDQHRGDCLDFVTQANGSRVAVQTPHLRRLAESGVCFPRFYSESPVCVPARAILQTGRLPHRLDMYSNADVLPRDHPTLASCLAAHGYFCQAIGKMHFRPVREPHGFHRLWLSEEIPARIEEDEFLQWVVQAGYGHVEEPHGIRHELYELPQPSQLPETHHTTAWTGRRTIEFLREHLAERPDQPFFCWTSFQKPHPPYEPPVPWHRLYRPAMAPAPIRSADELAWLPGAMRAGVARGEYPDVHRLATMWGYYFGSISFIDSWIGMILDELEGAGLRENTVVLYTADHGEMMGDHWSLGKSRFYEQSACVPGVLSWPAALPQGVVRRQLAGLADVVPTLLECAAVDPEPRGLRPDGVSLLATARDDAPTREVLIGQVGRGAQAQLMALSEDWKYVYSAGENRELLFRPRGDAPELLDYLGTRDGEALEAAGALRRALQERYRADGVIEPLDESSPNGFRLFPARAVPHHPATPSGVRAHNMQYARWIEHLPADWTPPPPTPDGQPSTQLPLRSDRSRYVWPPLPVPPASPARPVAQEVSPGPAASR
ncbi:MAG TPA: sulfatase-like hydrolase/transferase [Chloroflexota bacterium]|nr:sulfatase-like hydrolase/transferase [Chloroflexota bacterium]